MQVRQQFVSSHIRAPTRVLQGLVWHQNLLDDVIIATLGSNLGISALLEILQDASWTTKWYYNHWATHHPPHRLRNRPTRQPNLKIQIHAFCNLLGCLENVCKPNMSVPTYYVCPHLFCLSPPFMSVPSFYVCPYLLCVSPPIMSVPTFYVCPHLLCLSPPIMSVPTFYVCSHLLCLSPPIMSVPTNYVCPHL